MNKKCFILFFVLFQSWYVNAQEAEKKISMFRDSLDQAIDVSDWLLNKKGFLVIPSFITEPAVGYGLVGVGVYFHSSYSAKNGPPSMSGVLGGGTENGTWLAGAFHAGYWNHDRIRYLGAIAKTSANLGFYGSGNIDLVGDMPINLNLDAWLFTQQAKFRLAESDFFLGGRYLYMNTDNTFDAPIDMAEFDTIRSSASLSEATMVIDFDSRNNVFTPTSGFFIEIGGTYSDTWMGGEGLYGRIATRMIGYVPASEQLILGIRHESNFTFGDVPFWARPIVVMRGAPMMKYQNKNTTLFEAELDWNLYKRWTLVGFTGLGNAFSDIESFEKGKSVATIGTGFRYLAARKFGIKMGMDFAKSNDDFAFYIVFGTAWLK